MGDSRIHQLGPGWKHDCPSSRALTGAFRTGKEKELPPLGHITPIRSYTEIGVQELWGTGYSLPMEEVAIRAKMGK